MLMTSVDDKCVCVCVLTVADGEEEDVLAAGRQDGGRGRDAVRLPV